MSSVLFANEIDASKVEYTKNKQTTAGPQHFRANINKKDFNIQLSKVRVFKPSNAKDIPNAKTKEDKFSLNVPLEPNSSFYKFLQDLEKANIRYLSQNSKEIYGKDLNEDDIVKHDYYNTMIRKAKDSKYPDSIRLKLGHRVKKVKVDDQEVEKGIEAQFKVAVQRVGEDGSKKFEDVNINVVGEDGLSTIDFSWAFNGMEVVPIISKPELWVINKKQTYCTFRLVYLRVYARDSMPKIDANSFRDDDTNSAPLPPMKAPEVVEKSEEEIVTEEECEEEEE
jgi:hypothetical protein